MKCKSILIVEDDPAFRNLLVEYMGECFYPVEQAANGQEALDKVVTMPQPVFILLDWRMPVMTGEEFSAHFYSLEPQIKAEIVIMSASHVVWHKENKIINKPIGLEVIQGLLEEYCKE